MASQLVARRAVVSSCSRNCCNFVAEARRLTVDMRREHAMHIMRHATAAVQRGRFEKIHLAWLEFVHACSWFIYSMIFLCDPYAMVQLLHIFTIYVLLNAHTNCQPLRFKLNLININCSKRGFDFCRLALA
jgi:hypothetical protein